jgi:hypothetical protein
VGQFEIYFHFFVPRLVSDCGHYVIDYVLLLFLNTI